MNSKIIFLFNELSLYYQIKGDIYRERAYKKAVESIKKMRNEIKKVEDVLNISGIGKGLQEKIKLILQKEESKFLPKDIEKLLKGYKIIMGVKEIGPKKAKKILEKYEIKSKKDLEKISSELLTSSQKIGIKYYDDLNTKIPRNEMKKIEKILKKIGKNIDKKLEIHIVGSYRRKKTESSDIDILMFHPQIKISPDFNENTNYLELFIKKLIEKKIIEYIFKKSQKDAKSLNSELLLKFDFSDVVRKADIKFYPLESYATALLYFTGSGNFNRNMRAYAKRLGYKLSDYLLLKIKTGEIIKVQSEKDIFNILKLKYIEPKFRE